MDRKLERRTKVSGLILVGGLLLAAGFGATAKPPKKLLDEYARSIEQKSAALDSIKSELKRGREKLEDLKKKEGSYLTQLTQLERNIDNSQQYINEVVASIDTISQQMVVLSDSLQVANRQLSYRQALMRKRLRIMYKVGRSYSPTNLMGVMELAASSQGIADLLHRVRYAQEVNRYDRRLMETIETLRSGIEERAVALEERREMLYALKMEKEQQQGTLVAQTAERRKMLDAVQDEKDAYESMVAELEQAQKELNILIATLEKKRKDAQKEWER